MNRAFSIRICIRCNLAGYSVKISNGERRRKEFFSAGRRSEFCIPYAPFISVTVSKNGSSVTYFYKIRCGCTCLFLAPQLADASPVQTVTLRDATYGLAVPQGVLLFSGSTNTR